MVCSFNHRMKRLRKARWIALAVIALSISASALSWPSPKASPLACKAPSIHVFKREGVLELHCEGKLARQMGATFGQNPQGPKEREGDERTPEGAYRISSKVVSERFHRFLGVSYPNEEDLRRAKQKGIEKPGFGIGIHGTTKKLAPLARAWIRVARTTGLVSKIGPTDGCIGVDNEDVEALYTIVPIGTPVFIAPARPEPPPAADASL
jgi:murein L,D-transpeptidase YafK